MSKWNELTISQRNELLGIYAKQGYKNLNAIKQHYNQFADGGYVGNYGEVSPEVKHNVQHMNQPFFYNNNPSNIVHRVHFNYFDQGGLKKKKKDLQNLHTIFGVN